jgi:carbamoyltransferase
MSHSGLVLGVNFSHDLAACAIVDGKVGVAIAEERLSRIKHYVPVNDRSERFLKAPSRSILYCLNAVGADISDVDLLVASNVYVMDLNTGQRRYLTSQDVAGQIPGLDPARIRVVSHHLGHAASAGWCSGFSDATVMVVDGGGSAVSFDDLGHPNQFERTTIFTMLGPHFKLLKRSTGGPPAYGNSIGDFYQVITRFLGFRWGEEGKTMGLAAYGYPDCTGVDGDDILHRFNNAIVVRPDGTHCVSKAFQYTADQGFPSALEEWFGPPRRRAFPEQSLDQRIAGAAQRTLEEALLEIARAARSLSGQSRLCLAGGVALNCLANHRLLKESGFSEIFIQPASSDDGTALGNALLGWWMLRRELPDIPSPSPYLGRSYSSAELDAAVRQFEGSIEVHSCLRPAKEIAATLMAGKIVGLLRGGSEFGPRALGHRSILCDPRPSQMKGWLNRKVKHREPFRPFGPMVLERAATEYFDLPAPSPFMLFAAPVRQPEKIPSVTHIDNSARIQTVNKQQEPFLYDLLEEFESLTNVPVLLNTSLNIANEPIAETPEDALRCFLSTEIDVLFLEDRCIRKKCS